MYRRGGRWAAVCLVLYAYVAPREGDSGREKRAGFGDNHHRITTNVHLHRGDLFLFSHLFAAEMKRRRFLYFFVVPMSPASARCHCLERVGMADEFVGGFLASPEFFYWRFGADALGNLGYNQSCSCLCFLVFFLFALCLSLFRLRKGRALLR